jgi:hypothetical protein
LGYELFIRLIQSSQLVLMAMIIAKRAALAIGAMVSNTIPLTMLGNLRRSPWRPDDLGPRLQLWRLHMGRRQRLKLVVMLRLDTANGLAVDTKGWILLADEEIIMDDAPAPSREVPDYSIIQKHVHETMACNENRTPAGGKTNRHHDEGAGAWAGV